MTKGSHLKWVYPIDGAWCAKSTNGYYAVGKDAATSTYEAFHIEALWASPKLLLGLMGSVADAQAVCEAHAAYPRP